MDRKTYYAAHSAARHAARELARRDDAQRSLAVDFIHEGHFAMIFATRSTARGQEAVKGGPARIVIRTLADRPLRAKAAEELAHAAECRRSAASWGLHPAVRVLRLREAHRTIEIARAFHSAFNRLPA